MNIIIAVIAMLFALFIMTAVLLVAVLTMFRPARQVLDAIDHRQQSPLELLHDRYQRGEVTTEEYEAIRIEL